MIKDPETQVETLRRITVYYGKSLRAPPTFSSPYPYVTLFLTGGIFRTTLRVQLQRKGQEQKT